jgi:hypothetical protein
MDITFKKKYNIPIDIYKKNLPFYFNTDKNKGMKSIWYLERSGIL